MDDGSSLSSCDDVLPSWEFMSGGVKHEPRGIDGYQFEPSTDGESDEQVMSLASSVIVYDNVCVSTKRGLSSRSCGYIGGG